MEFREIDKGNFRECMNLKVDESQKYFVADNKQSLVEASYEDGLYTLGVYHEDVMVGFILYDFDNEIGGWSMSRFMIGEQYQGKGYGKMAVKQFFTYIKEKHKVSELYISVSLNNKKALNMYASMGFSDVKEVSYTYMGMTFNEMQMVKIL